jgi:hypothetical protein
MRYWKKITIFIVSLLKKKQRQRILNAAKMAVLEKKKSDKIRRLLTGYKEKTKLATATGASLKLGIKNESQVSKKTISSKQKYVP